ncbi:MAG: bifunctional oligoribonuclease/PAP phosphatase NrnA [Bacilli bacterium]|nr:bifunctional oligoribonuclease/PAP phosphatase NrnA [Bacilli bacterium]
MNIFRRIYKEIKKYNKIIIARHIGPDPDALGGQFALKELIQNKFNNKKVYAIGSSPAKFKFFGNLDRLDEINIDDDTLLIILDTPDIKRIDGIDNIKEYKNIIKIDHHPIIDNYESLSLIDETSSSTCQLILELIFKNHLKLTKSIAEKLYMGIVSDTGRFMHDYTTKKTFELVTKLLKKSNINFTSLYSPLYARPLSEIKFQGFIFENIELTDNGLAYIKITDDILKEYGVDAASAGNIISELNFVNEIKIWMFLTEDKKNNQIRANIRSRGPIINEIASKYGGGGHKYASGARLSSWDKANELLEKLDDLITKE